MIVRQTTKYVVNNSKHVIIYKEGIEKICKRHLAIPPPHPFYPKLKVEDLANYVLAVDAINFCFWPKPKWHIHYEGKEYSGAYGMAVAMKKAVERGVPVYDARFMASVKEGQLKEILREAAMLPERTRNLNEIGELLLRKYNGKFSRMIERAKNDVHALVELLASAPSFDDTSCYKGRRVEFYKRAQLCVADLKSAFSGKGLGRFKNLEELTALADYKLPQVLRELRILDYSEELQKKIDNCMLIKKDSEEEVEIRAATIQAVELISKKTGRRAIELDWALWNLSHSLKAKPHHRTLTIFY